MQTPYPNYGQNGWTRYPVSDKKSQTNISSWAAYIHITLMWDYSTGDWGAARNEARKSKGRARREKAEKWFVGSLHRASLFFVASSFFRTAPSKTASLEEAMCFKSGFLMADGYSIVHFEFGIALFTSMIFCHPSVLVVLSKRSVNGYQRNWSMMRRRPSMDWRPIKGEGRGTAMLQQKF